MNRLSNAARRLLAALLAGATLLPLLAHGGGLDANGGHWDRKAGTYHFHQAPAPAPTATTTPAPAPSTSQAQAPQADPKTVVVYITRTGEKYHRDGCRYLSQSKIQTTLVDAVARGLGPCSVCRP